MRLNRPAIAAACLMALSIGQASLAQTPPPAQSPRPAPTPLALPIEGLKEVAWGDDAAHFIDRIASVDGSIVVWVWMLKRDEMTVAGYVHNTTALHNVINCGARTRAVIRSELYNDDRFLIGAGGSRVLEYPTNPYSVDGRIWAAVCKGEFPVGARTFATLDAARAAVDSHFAATGR